MANHSLSLEPFVIVGVALHSIEHRQLSGDVAVMCRGFFYVVDKVAVATETIRSDDDRSSILSLHMPLDLVE